MKTILVMLYFVCGSFQIHAQSISKQVIGSSGKSLSNGINLINFTVGEPIVGMVQSGVTIHQGFWAELFNDGTLSVSIPVSHVNEVRLYPNPVVSYLQIQFKQNEAIHYEAKLFDINGKQVLYADLQSQNKNNQLDVSFLSNGIYVLSITSIETKYQKSFKIIKK